MAGVFGRTPRRAHFYFVLDQTSDLVKCRWIIAEVNAGGFLATMSLSIHRMNIPGRAIFPDSGTDHEIEFGLPVGSDRLPFPDVTPLPEVSGREWLFHSVLI